MEDADPIADSEERRELRRTLRRLIEEIAPPERIRELDAAGEFDVRLHTELAGVGVWALGGPSSEGGLGDIRDQLVAIEELAAGPTSMAVFAIVHYMITHILHGYGSDEQGRELLPQLLLGQAKGSFALTEPGGGTDVATAMATRAHRTDDGTWILSGQKTWISGATLADVLIVLARTGEGSGVEGISMFLVPADADGVSVHELDTFAVHGLDTCEVVLEDVRLPADAVLGEADQGFRQVLTTLNRERLGTAAGALGAGRGALEAATAYASERVAFGKPIGSFQAIQHRLVDGAIALESARGLIVRAAHLEAAGQRADILSAMAKVEASEAAVKITQDGMQVLGGSGFSREFPMERWFRDVRLWTFAPLNNEMMRNYLGERHLGLARSF